MAFDRYRADDLTPYFSRVMWRHPNGELKRTREVDQVGCRSGQKRCCDAEEGQRGMLAVSNSRYSYGVTASLFGHD